MKKLSYAEMRAFQADQLAFMQQAAAELGGVAHLKMLNLHMFLISEPALVRELLVHHSHQMHRDPFVSRVFKRFTGNGVFTAEDALWQRQRKLLQPAFHAMRIRAYADVMAAYARDMVLGWQTGDAVAVDQALTQLTLRIIAKTMYDVDLAAETAEIGRLMQEILTVAEAQLKMTFLPPAWLPTRLNRRQAAALRQVRDLLRQIVHRRQAEGVDHGDLLSMLLSVRDEAGRPMPEAQLLDECVTLFVAGHETTAAALTWTWHLLTQHPDVLQRLAAEVDAALGGMPVTFERLAAMPLLEAAIKETLRLYPPAFGFGRTVMAPFSAGGIDFPKGAVILFSTFVTHRRPDLYVNPAHFRPERFLDKETAPDRYAYFPFGAGPRICLGNMFAMLEAQVILATMLQHVTLAPATDRPVTLETVVTLRPRDALLLRVTRRGVG
ncbi:MAG: cytochrome P450 [Anaerolineales bacterium]|nr:cytochrome P450 [Anaerolineales bacterium]